MKEDSGTTQEEEDFKKTPAKMLLPTPSKHCMCNISSFVVNDIGKQIWIIVGVYCWGMSVKQDSTALLVNFHKNQYYQYQCSFTLRLFHHMYWLTWRKSLSSALTQEEPDLVIIAFSDKNLCSSLSNA